MAAISRRPRVAAQRAENKLNAIAKQEKETRDELSSIARSANVDQVPSKIFTVKVRSEKGFQVLAHLARQYPDTAQRAQAFEILRFNSPTAKRKFEVLVSAFVESELKQRKRTEIQQTAKSNPIKAVEAITITDSISVQQLESRENTLKAAIFPHRGHQHTSIPKPRSTAKIIPPKQSFRHHPPTQQIIILPAEGQSDKSTTPPNCEYNTDRGGKKPNILARAACEEIRVSSSSITCHVGQTSQKTLNSAMGPFQTPVPLLETPYLSQQGPARRQKAVGDHTAGAFQDFWNNTPRDLPEHLSYRVGTRHDQRLMKYQKPPNGWEGCISSVYNNDYSDPRFWPAPSVREQEAVWRAQYPTIIQFKKVTGTDFSRRQAILLPFGYAAVYDQIQREFSNWCFAELGCGHDWIVGGKVIIKLFKLERWYGLVEDYEFAPNWPFRRRDSSSKILQNPDCFACRECINLNIFCHGHREDRLVRCKPCIDDDRLCSKTIF